MDNTPKNFIVQLGSLIALYISITSFLILIFGIINLVFPDAADNYWQYESAQDGIRYSIATLVVFFPTYLVLTRLVNKARRGETKLYHTLTKWVVYLSLLVGGLVLLGDLVAVIMGFLNGELTTRFLLKAGAIFLVVGAAFDYYLLDAKGYWLKREKQSLMIGGVTLLFVIMGVVYGYSLIDTPSVVREMKIDQEQVSDLQNMQWRIEDHYRSEEVLPDNLEAVFAETALPTAPEDRAAYRYSVVDEESYEVCATFVHDSREQHFAPVKLHMVESGYHPGNYNWEYQTGEKCFQRKVELQPE